MAGGLWERLKNWVLNENLSHDDLNSEFNNVIANFRPDKIDDYSASVTQMQVETTPGAVGTESLATSTAGEIERLRYVIRRLIGDSTTYKWYSAAPRSIKEINDLLNIQVPAPDNRILSGRKDADNQPIFLVPNGAARTVTLKGLTTNFVTYIDGVAFTATTDISLASLTAAPSSNNTATYTLTKRFGGTVLASEATRTIGEVSAFECNPTIAEPVYAMEIGSAGTEITALVGKWAAFKIAGAATEYFLAFVESSTRLTNVMRGYFFNSSDAGIARTTLTNGNTITLMKLSYIFLKNDSTLDVTYNQPSYGSTAPTSPASGDYWFDTSVKRWKKYSGTTWSNASTTFVGTCIQDTTNTVAARSTEFYAPYDDTMKIRPKYVSTTRIIAGGFGQRINVSGYEYSYAAGQLEWSPTVIESGVTLNSARSVFLYVKDTGDGIVSDKAPFDRLGELGGFYHPFKPWKCVGVIGTDGTVFSGTMYGFAETLRDMTRARVMSSTLSGVREFDNWDNSTGGPFATSLSAKNTASAWVSGLSLDATLYPLARFMGRGQYVLVQVGRTINSNGSVGDGPAYSIVTGGGSDDAAIGVGAFEANGNTKIQVETIVMRSNSAGTSTVSNFGDRTILLGPLPEGKECYIDHAFISNAATTFSAAAMFKFKELL